MTDATPGGGNQICEDCGLRLGSVEWRQRGKTYLVCSLCHDEWGVGDPAIHAVAYDYEEPYPDPDTRNYWHIYEVGMAGDDEISGTIAAPNTPEMHAAIKRIVGAVNRAYAIARRLREEAGSNG